MTLRLSRFTHVVRGNGWFAWYHALSQERVFGGPELERLFEKASEKQRPEEFLAVDARAPIALVRELAGKKFFASAEEDGKMLENAAAAPMANGVNICRLYLLTTNRCNLACKYCAIESGKPRGFEFCDMTEQTAKKAVDLFAQTLWPRAELPVMVIYGGEPLLNWKTTRFAIEYARRLQEEGRLPQNLKISLKTNATLMTPKIAEELAELYAEVDVSLDGTAEQHDRLRVKRDGRGSWEDAVKGAGIVREKTGELNVIFTIGNHNIAGVGEAFGCFKELGVTGVGINPVDHIGDGPEAKALDAAFFNAVELAENLGIKSLGRISKIRQYFREKRLRPHHCDGYGSQIAVTPDGRIGPCHIMAERGERVVASLNEDGLPEKLRTSGAMIEMARSPPFRREECQDCIGLGLCGGGCLASALENGLGINDTNKGKCMDWARMIGSLLEKELGARQRGGGNA